MASTAKASVKVFFNLVVLQLLGKQISVEEQKHTKPRSLKNTKTNNQKPGKRHPTNNRGQGGTDFKESPALQRFLCVIKGETCRWQNRTFTATRQQAGNQTKNTSKAATLTIYRGIGGRFLEESGAWINP